MNLEPLNLLIKLHRVTLVQGAQNVLAGCGFTEFVRSAHSVE